jgi:RNA polymerase sigma-70 factor (ECF subfamily)
VAGLLEPYVDALGRPVSESESDALAAALDAAYAAGQDRWPRLSVEPAAFARGVARRAETEADIAALCHADLFLALACVAGAPGAIESFSAHYDALLSAIFARVRAQGTGIDDLRQRLLERLFVGGGHPKILEYEARGSLKTWVRVVASRLCIDADRKRADRVDRLETADPRLEQLGAQRDPELMFLEARYRAAFSDALRAAIEALEPRDRNLLRYVACDRMSATQIAGLYNVHRATAKRWLATARQQVLEGTRARLMAAEGIDAAELDSVMDLLRSRLDLTLTSHLRAPV